jgi:hypothetical protein
MEPAQAAVEVLARGASDAAAEAAAASAEEAALTAAIAPKLDEFGRDENVYRRSQAQARSKRRSALLATLRDQAQGNGAAQVLLGSEALSMAAAASAPGEKDDSASYYARRVKELNEIAAGVLDDVAPEFASLGAMLHRLKVFKLEHTAQYRTAFLSEALPALSSVFTRLQLLQWDPLYGGGLPRAEQGDAVNSFEAQEWFLELFEFSGARATSFTL